VLPPGSQIGPITPEQRRALLQNSLVAGVYEKLLDRESAYEKLRGAAPAAGAPATPGQAPAAAAEESSMFDGLKGVLFGTTGPRGAHHEGLAEQAARSAMRTMGSAVGREIIRGVLGSILGGSSKRR
jgi:hypothetical protein